MASSTAINSTTSLGGTTTSFNTTVITNTTVSMNGTTSTSVTTSSTFPPTNSSQSSNSTSTSPHTGSAPFSCWLDKGCWRPWLVVGFGLLVLIVFVVVAVCCMKKRRRVKAQLREKKSKDALHAEFGSHPVQPNKPGDSTNAAYQEDAKLDVLYEEPQPEPVHRKPKKNKSQKLSKPSVTENTLDEASVVYEVLSGFRAKDVTQLTVQRGDLVQLEDADADMTAWVWVKGTSGEGYMPGPFLQLRRRHSDSELAITELLRPKDQRDASQPAVGVEHLVMYDYDATDNPASIPLRVGDSVLVLEETSAGWSRGLRDDIEGWFPSSYVRRLETSDNQTDTRELDASPDTHLQPSSDQQLLKRISRTRLVTVPTSSYKPCAAVKPQLQAPPPPLPRIPIPNKPRRNIHRDTLPSPPLEDVEELYINTQAEDYQNAPGKRTVPRP